MALIETKLKVLADGRHYDDKGVGLFLHVNGGGRRWAQRLRIAGKQREIGLGSYPSVSLATARRRAEANRRAVEEGRDPIAERQTRRVVAKTMRDATEAWIEAHGSVWRSDKTRKLVRSRLDHHAGKLLSRPVAGVTVEDVRATLAPIWSAKPEMARKLRTWLELSLEYAIAARWRPGPNPAVWKGTLRPLLAKPSGKVRHHPALSAAQVQPFLAALRLRDGHAARALELLIYTACRSGEVRAMRWGEVDMTVAVWTVPADKMKSGRLHRVPLSEPAMRLLRAQPRGAEWVFPSRENTPLSDAALTKVVRDMDKAEPWRDDHGARIVPHGFRATFRSWVAATGKDRWLAEAQLAHVVGDKTERAYQRDDLLERRAVLMAEWAAHCERESADIVSLARSA